MTSRQCFDIAARRCAQALALSGILLATRPAAAQPPGVAASPPRPAAVEQGIAVYFSPQGGCAAAITEQIERARRTIDVQAFSLTSSLFGRPLIAARNRGVRVRVIFDKRQAEEEYSWDERLSEAGVEVYYDAPEDGSNHNKVMLLDGHRIVTGSFNFSRSAEEKNVENLLMIADKPRIFAAYQRNFDQRLRLSKRKR